MAGHGLQARGIARRNKMLKAATFLFLEQGYDMLLEKPITNNREELFRLK